MKATNLPGLSGRLFYYIARLVNKNCLNFRITAPPLCSGKKLQNFTGKLKE